MPKFNVKLTAEYWVTVDADTRGSACKAAIEEMADDPNYDWDVKAWEDIQEVAL